MTCTHLRREHLIIGTRWFLENVKQDSIDMFSYMNSCGTSGCFVGWMSRCPQLNACGFYYSPELKAFLFNQAVENGHVGRRMLQFFGLTEDQCQHLFLYRKSGLKADILQRVWDVLQQPSPYDEPQIQNLDEEWRQLQHLIVDPSTSQVRSSPFQGESLV